MNDFQKFEVDEFVGWRIQDDAIGYGEMTKITGDTAVATSISPEWRYRGILG